MSEESIGATLRLLGCRVAQADDEEGMDACRDEYHDQVQLIVLDQGAFGGRGMAYVHGMRHNGVQIPIVVISGEDEADPQVQELTRVISLVKPFGMPELSRVVCEVLGIG